MATTQAERDLQARGRDLWAPRRKGVRALYLASSSGGAGKTALAAALGRRLLAGGKQVGYFKPLSQAPGEDRDALFLKQLFGLTEATTTLAPFRFPPEDGDLGPRLPQIRNAFTQASRGKDVVLVEGAPVPAAALSLAEALSAPVLLILRYGDGVQPPAVVEAARPFGARLVGVVVNGVPRGSLPFVARGLRPALEAADVLLLGLLPEDPRLASCTVDELAAGLGSQLLSGAARGGELVKGVRLGPMSADTAGEYFQRLTAMFAIIRSDRPDLQLGALDRQVGGLLLTKDSRSQFHPNVRYRAEDEALPLMAVAEDTLTALGRVEQFFSQVRFHQPGKLPYFEALLAEHFNFGALEAFGFPP